MIFIIIAIVVTTVKCTCNNERLFAWSETPGLRELVVVVIGVCFEASFGLSESLFANFCKILTFLQNASFLLLL